MKKCRIGVILRDMDSGESIFRQAESKGVRISEIEIRIKKKRG